MPVYILTDNWDNINNDKSITGQKDQLCDSISISWKVMLWLAMINKEWKQSVLLKHAVVVKGGI